MQCPKPELGIQGTALQSGRQAVQMHVSMVAEKQKMRKVQKCKGKRRRKGKW